MLSKFFKKNKKSTLNTKVEKLNPKELKAVNGGIAHELTHTVQQGGGVVKG